MRSRRQPGSRSDGSKRGTVGVNDVHCVTVVAAGGVGAADVAITPLHTRNSNISTSTAATPIATAAAIFFVDVGFWPVARPVCPFTRKRNTRSL